MISRAHRFHGLGSLHYVYRQGQTVRGPLLAVRYMLNKRRTTYRAAIVVSRKVHKSAVVRNRIRRRIYEAIRLNEPQITEPLDIVITVFSAQVAELATADLTKLVQSQLAQAGIIPASKAASEHVIVKPKEN
jgi:ribonuclease P protein component